MRKSQFHSLVLIQVTHRSLHFGKNWVLLPSPTYAGEFDTSLDEYATVVSSGCSLVKQLFPWNPTGRNNFLRWPHAPFSVWISQSSKVALALSIKTWILLRGTYKMYYHYNANKKCLLSVRILQSANIQCPYLLLSPLWLDIRRGRFVRRYGFCGLPAVKQMNTNWYWKSQQYTVYSEWITSLNGPRVPKFYSRCHPSLQPAVCISLWCVAFRQKPAFPIFKKIHTIL